MTMTDDEMAARPSLRIAEMAITNFRTFRSRQVLRFADGSGEPDSIITFHGDNGAGKSSALHALDQFFLALTFCLSTGDDKGEIVSSWDTPIGMGDSTLVLSARDRPAGQDGPTEFEVRFHDPRLGAFRVRYIPSGKRVRVRAEHRPAAVAEGDGFAPVKDEIHDQLLTWLQTPLGPQSRPFAILDERRQLTRLPATPQVSLLHPALAEELLSLRTNLDAMARTRWRAFVESLQTFPQFKGKVIEIQRATAATPEIVVEDPGKVVLRLDELSSGEQQLIVLYASVILASTPIVAIAEPELSLDDKNQRTFKALLEALVKGGQVDQIIVESHVPAFDGERVLRFRRSEARNTEVERVSLVGPEAQEIRRRAKQQGAEQSWVTRDGYTRLPDIMCTDLGIGPGAHVWFLKNHDRWGAWPEDELEELLNPRPVGEEEDE